MAGPVSGLGEGRGHNEEPASEWSQGNREEGGAKI